MLTQTGQVKVMDFGIARALASGASTMTQTSAVIGTAQYLSPEQARGEAVDARSDVYATGCVIYELLCGQPPFVGDNPVSVAYQHVREDPRPPSASNPDVTPSIDAIVLKALSKNPANRYQSAGEMRADLLRAAAGRPVLATPVMREDERTAMIAPAGPPHAGPATRPVARVGPPPRRSGNAWIVVALTLLGILAVGALGTGLYLANRTPTVEVPDLQGLTSLQAANELTRSKLKGVPGTVTNATCQKDTVTTQNPPARKKVNEGDTVTYQVCTGPGKKVVPPVIDMSRGEATKSLQDNGLTPAFAETDSDKPANTVIKADPPPGTSVNEGSSVKLTISRGNLKKLPSVLNQSESGARQALSGAGFKTVVTSTQPTDDPSKVGKVVGQDPDPGLYDPSNIKVTIFIGKAEQQNPPPTSAPPSAPPSNR
jgi:serine/threonine-protein kinase